MDVQPERKVDHLELVEIDLSFVTALDAVGLALLLARLVEFRNLQSYSDFDVLMPRAVDVRAHMEALGAPGLFERVLRRKRQAEPQSNLDLFDDIGQEELTPFRSAGIHEQLVSCLIEITPSATTSREAWVALVRAKLRTHLSQASERGFNEAQFHVIVTELVKNTIDHSGAEAFIGVDMLLDHERKRCARLNFVYVDTGIGISKSIRNFLIETQRKTSPPDATLERKIRKGNATEFIREAFMPDFTTKPNNGVNFGVGLTLIQRGIKGANFSGLLLDAKSAINITSFDSTKKLTHEEIRRGSSKMISNPPLTFHLEWSPVHDR